MVTVINDFMLLRWETGLHCDLNPLQVAASYRHALPDKNSLLFYMNCHVLAILLTFKGISLQLLCPCSGHSYSTQARTLLKAWLRAVSSAAKADHRCHHPVTQPLRPLFLSRDSRFRKQVCSTAFWISAPPELQKRNIWFNLEEQALYKFCLTTNST